MSFFRAILNIRQSGREPERHHDALAPSRESNDVIPCGERGQRQFRGRPREATFDASERVDWNVDGLPASIEDFRRDPVVLV